jgi:acyl-coenzyme A synthetase/AMP-(fatty) acid ligase
MYCDFRIGTAPGFRNMTTRLWSGGTIYFWGGDSSALLRAFDRHKIQNISSAPVGLSQFAQAFETDRAMAPHLDHVICQGAPLPKELAARIRAAVCENLYCLYASTEAGNVAFAPADLLEATPGSVGYVEPGVTVQIVDDADQIVPNGRQGKVRVRSPLLVSGYLNAPEVTAKVFRDGFFYPGDLGYLTPDRMLIVNGREDTVLNFGGHKTTPEAVEDVLMNFSGIQQAAVFSMPDASGIDVPWALIVTKSPLNEAALRTHCAKTLTDISVPARFIVVDEIPRSPAGKIERHRLRDWAERQDVARTGA